MCLGVPTCIQKQCKDRQDNGTNSQPGYYLCLTNHDIKPIFLSYYLQSCFVLLKFANLTATLFHGSI